jgi:hypothetical protein
MRARSKERSSSEVKIVFTSGSIHALLIWH